jgi:iron-sulfur cluster assembly protein
VESVLHVIGKEDMLTLTENASTIVKDIATQSGGEGVGLRITADPTAEASLSLTVTTSDHAEPGDQVVEQAGATVYLEDQVAEALSEMVLDAGVDQAGNVEFALGQQA